MKNTYLDYKIFLAPDFNKSSNVLSGDNHKHILIGFMDEGDNEMNLVLEKIVLSAKLNFTSDCLILRGDDALPLPSFSQISTQNKIEKAVLFGLKPTDLGLKIETAVYQVTEFNGCTFLFADKISRINTSIEHKRALWNGIQQMFLQ